MAEVTLEEVIEILNHESSALALFSKVLATGHLSSVKLAMDETAAQIYKARDKLTILIAG